MVQIHSSNHENDQFERWCAKNLTKTSDKPGSIVAADSTISRMNGRVGHEGEEEGCVESGRPESEADLRE
jgi:hypothetical protein